MIEISDNGDSTKCPQCGLKPKSLKVEAGKYGGLITAVLFACQFLDQLFSMP